MLCLDKIIIFASSAKISSRDLLDLFSESSQSAVDWSCLTASFSSHSSISDPPRECATASVLISSTEPSSLRDKMEISIVPPPQSKTKIFPIKSFGFSKAL